MKTVWVALVLLAMATTLYAKTRGYVHPVNRPIVHSRTSTKSNAPRCANAMNPYMLCKNTAAVSKKFCNECQRVEDAKAEERAKDMMERLKNVSVPKVALDENGRIVSICGYELGTIFRKGPRFIVDESGDIVVSGRLKKPFRKCNQVTLRYSKNSGALYSIRIFSNPQENMDRNKAETGIAPIRSSPPHPWRQAKAIHSGGEPCQPTRASPSETMYRGYRLRHGAGGPDECGK